MSKTNVVLANVFREVTIDGLIDTGALSIAIIEMDLRKIHLPSPQLVIRKGPPPNFLVMVAEGILQKNN